MIENILYELLSTINKNQKTNNKILVLMYHEVQDDYKDIESWTVVKKSEFESQMMHLLKTYTIVSICDAIMLAKSNKALDKNYAVITFDDGYIGNYEVVYPFVKLNNIPITIYVATKACQTNRINWYDEVINLLQGKRDCRIEFSNFNGKNHFIKSSDHGEKKWVKIQSLLEDLKSMKLHNRDLAIKSMYMQLGHNCVKEGILRHLDPNKIQELSKSPLVTIGAHSHCHSLLPNIPNEVALESIVNSKELLEMWTSKSVDHFSYPNGNYDEKVLAMVEQSGFESSVTTQAGYWQFNESFFKIRRLGIGRYDTLEKFKYRILRPSR